jgi:type II secretory ATPase GspE/PulE/Tfp pilus assembly ATPase PilB-like protein
MTTIHKFPKIIQAALISRIKILSKLNITERRLPQDGQFSIERNGRSVDFRISTLPCKYGEKIVIRVLDKSNLDLDLSQLGFDPQIEGMIETLIHKPQGMILVTGPTGSGKTTTLYSILNRLKSPTKNVVTLEDPVEYELLADKHDETGITQVPMNSKIGMDFAAGLRATLRQDPDIIMVGEIRDKETSEIAMKASLTGHMVLSTLHSNDTFSTMLRLKDIGVELYLISATVTFILAQRLVRLLCKECRQPYQLHARAIKHMFEDDDTVPGDLTLYRAKGCPACLGSGYRGRAAIVEMMVMDDEIKEFINTRMDYKNISAFMKMKKIKSLRKSGMDMVKSGVTTVEEIFRITVD